jgi:hypothetical protein
MPLAERDINTQHHRPLTRGKRLHAAVSVMGENAVPSSSVVRAQETPTRQQRFHAPTKASAAKYTPSPTADHPRALSHSHRDTPLSQTQTTKIPRRNVDTHTPKPAYDPPVSKWNLSATTNLAARSDRTFDTRPASPSPAFRGIAQERSLVSGELLRMPRTSLTHMSLRSRTRLLLPHTVLVPKSRCHLAPLPLLPTRQARHETVAA